MESKIRNLQQNIVDGKCLFYYQIKSKIENKRNDFLDQCCHSWHAGQYKST